MKPVAWLSMAAFACSGRSHTVEDARSVKPTARDAASPPPTPPEPYRVESQFESGDVQIRVEWVDVPTAARTPTARPSCDAAPASVAPTTTWGIPDAVVMVDVQHGRSLEPIEARVVVDNCGVSPRVAVANSMLVVASASDAPTALKVSRSHAARPLTTAAPEPEQALPIQLPVIGHEVEVSLTSDFVYALRAGSETAVVVAAATPYYAVTEANGQAIVRQVPTGTHPVAAWIPARAGQPARAAAGVVRVTANALAEVTLDLSRPQ